MMARTDKFKKSYRFLSKKEQTGQLFTLKELSDAIGWKESTVQTYLHKKWNQFVFNQDNGFYVDGISDFTEEQYIRLMSQKQDVSASPKRPVLESRVESLVIKAREAAIHALDSYNRPATIFRTEGYIVLMVIAWTSLLHAIFEKRGVDYFYKEDVGSPIIIDGDKKAWELTQCLKEYFGDSNPPQRANLQFIIGLRNRIEHRFVPAIDPHVAGECQALILNFDEFLVGEFGNYYALRETLTVPLQTTHLRDDTQLETMKKFQGNEYDELKDYIDTFRDGLADTVYQDPRYSFRVYLIPKIGNHESSSDIAYEFVKYDPENPDDIDALDKQVALIRERQVPVVNAGLYKPSQVARLVSEKTGREFSIHYHTQAWRMYGVRASGENPEGCDTRFCQFDTVHRDYVYTQEWVDFLVGKLSDETEYEALRSFRG
jgi:hypothetical protein